MNLGILTFHHASNYGAVLQTYATCKQLKKLGYEPLVLDYRPVGLYEHYYKISWKRFGLVGQNFINLRLNPKFKCFRERWLPVSERCFESCAELVHTIDTLDGVFYGSDQIWNPKLFGNTLDSAFWANGVSPEIRKVALSASFGGTEGLYENYHQEVARYIRNFDMLSVREQQAADLICAITGEVPEVLMDPVFSADSWDELLEPMPGYEDCVFQFVLQQNQDVADSAELLAEHYETRVVSGNSGIKRFGDPKEVVSPSVGQWLWLIKNAAHVVTNSFHATAFATIFRRPITVVELQAGMATRNQRITNLLGLGDLNDRMVKRLESGALLEHHVRNPDYSIFEGALRTNRERFESYIVRSLS